MALGAAAGMAATFVLQGMLAASKKLLPESVPPIKGDPGKFMLRKAESLLSEERREQIPDLARQAAIQSLRMGYGMSSGALYGTLRSRGGNALLDGTLLGVGVWVAGYLGWLPATGLMPPISEQNSQQIAVPLIEHALFGIALVTAYDAFVGRY
jgi:hypothetical protein